MPVNFPTYSWWVQIEGVPNRISIGEPSPESFRVDSDAITDNPQSISDSCDPITAEVSLSAFTFQANASDLLVELLLYQQVEPVARVDQEMSDSTTSMFTTVDLGVEAGDPIYVGAETVRVVNVVASAAYTIARGQYDTRAQEHPVGRGVNTRVPRWRGRGIELYSRDTSRNPAATLRWSGFVDRIKRVSNGTKIAITGRNRWAAAIETKSGRASFTARSVRARIREVGDDPARPLLKGSANAPIGIFNSNSPDEAYYAQFGEALVAVRVRDTYEDECFVEFDSRSLLGSTIEYEVEEDPLDADLRPIFLISPIADDQWIADRDLVSDVGGQPWTPSVLSPAMTPYCYHPYQIAVFLLTGGVLDASGGLTYYDYANQFTLDFRDLLGDDFVERVADLIEATPDLKVDHFMMGWGADEADVFSTVSEKLLRPYGAFFGVTQSGLPDIRRFAAMTVADIEEVEADSRIIEALPGPWVGDVDPALEQSIDVVSAVVGELPWRDGRKVEVSAVGAGSGRTRIGDGGRWELDYSTLSVNKAFEVVENLVRKSTFSAFSFPRIRVRCPDTTMDDLYDIGGAVRVDTLPVEGAYLLDNTGTIIEFLDDDIDTQIQFYGIIIERQFFPGPRTYEIVVMLTSWRTAPIRFRGPAGVVIGIGSFEGRATIELEDDTFSTLANAASDFSEFFGEDGDDGAVTVDICNADLSTKATMPVREFRPSENDIVLTIASTPAVAGEVIRLSSYDSGMTLPETGLVIYNFLADANEVLGDDDDPGHEYG